MSYNTELFYGIKCDCCGKQFEDNYNGWSYWVDKSTAREEADEEAWYIDDNTALCTDCHEVDEDDNLYVKGVKMTTQEALAAYPGTPTPSQPDNRQ